MTASPAKWVRVNRHQPCPVCGRVNWCTLSGDGTAVNCPRTPNDKPIISATTGELSGYLHKLADHRPMALAPTCKATPPATISAAAWVEMNRGFQRSMSSARLDRFAASLGVSTAGLHRIGTGWDIERARWTFPMFDGDCRVIGIRTRNADGSKRCVVGSHNGLFVPASLSPAGSLGICEGPTTLAALLDMGIEAIGMPSCSSGGKALRRWVDRAGFKGSITIYGDRDTRKTRPDGSHFYPGQEGAAALAKSLATLGRAVRIKFPPDGFKDFRDWRKHLAAKVAG